jgi:hypothetical protein
VFERSLRLTGQLKPLNNLSADKMGLDNFLDVLFVDRGVPNTFRVDHENRAKFASVKASRLVNPNRASALKPECFNPRLGKALQCLCTLSRTTRPAGIALIETKKHMMAVEHSKNLTWV